MRSAAYDYVKSLRIEPMAYSEPVSEGAGHYEVEAEVEEEPYWEPASREDVLRRQLDQLKLTDTSTQSLRYMAKF